MKYNRTATRVLAGVLPAMALFATSARGQELQTQTTPPPVPSTAAPAPTPATPTSGASGTVSRAQYDAAVQAATGATAPVEAPASDVRPARAARAVPPARRVAPAPVPAASTAAPATAPSAQPAVPEAAAPAVPAPVASAPAEPAAAATTAATDTQTGSSSGFPAWGWLLVGLAVIAALAGAGLAMRRRRERDEWVDEIAYDDAAPVAGETVVAAPLVSSDAPIEEHADLVRAEDAEIAAITDASAPVSGRPWIELSLRPIRAGATDESALVDLELTLANAGEVAAEDVRVATFMLGDAADAPTDLDRLLAGSHAGTTVDAGVIGAGEGSRIDARLAVPREGMDGATFQPVVVADVRYRLPGGGEGRTAAAFTVGVADGTDDPTPLRLGGDMREDISATLHGVPERA